MEKRGFDQQTYRDGQDVRDDQRPHEDVEYRSFPHVVGLVRRCVEVGDHQDVEEVRDYLDKQVDVIVDSGSCGVQMTTVIDLSEDSPDLVRAGKGPLAPFGLEPAGT